ncbi:MAG: CPBP family intramembrane metalloprotease, partial [Acidobacteria bacterium]|nr:CPBP family intramembrane metalloprotease [Acidobacteriota bacterium]
LWLFFIYFIITVKYRRRFWEAIRWLREPRPGAYLLAGVALALGANLIFSLFPSEKQLPIERLFSSTQSAYVLAIFGICVAPFVEELVFRGFFYPLFERLWGLAVAVLLSAGLFALIHIPQLRGGWQEIAAIFFVGAAFSYCRGKTGSLLPPYLMHVGYNASLFVGLYFSTDRFRSLQG